MVAVLLLSTPLASAVPGDGFDAAAAGGPEVRATPCTDLALALPVSEEKTRSLPDRSPPERSPEPASEHAARQPTGRCRPMPAPETQRRLRPFARSATAGEPTH